MKKKLIQIGKKKIGEGRPVFVIAEAGVNHNGSVSIAKKLIDKAVDAGADAVKFQTYKTELLVTRNAPTAFHQKSANKKSQFELLKSLELSASDFAELFAYCKKRKIIFLSTPYDHASAEFLNRLGVAAFKIGSGDLTNLPLLRQIASYKKPFIVSTGMSNIVEIKEAVKAIRREGNTQLILLHCITSYPARYRDVNLRTMQNLKDTFDVMVGYSDHTIGNDAAVAAVALGASIIEKHFTLSRKMAGPDHKASLEPYELKELIQSIRNVEAAMGSRIKKMSAPERIIGKIVRKSIVAVCAISKGSLIRPEMLAIKRPGTGIAPKFFNQIVGKEANRHIKKETLISWKMLS